MDRGPSEHKSVKRRIRGVMLIVLFVLLGCLIIVICVLIVLSPGKPRTILDAYGRSVVGSISEKTFVKINGVRQGMFMMGRDKDNPILLFVHGGMPAYFLTERYPTGLEYHFTVCWWEQRGAGLSYRPAMAKKTVTVDQLISDTIAMTNYLRNRFGKEKICLMGHSGGTFIAIQAAAKAPRLYHLDALTPAQRNEVEVFACGPHPMLEGVAKLARDYNLPCQVSMEEFMACGVGGCAGCVVEVKTDKGSAMKRVCVDGPVFDARAVFFG